MPISNSDILRVALRWLVNGTDEQVNVHTFRVDSIGTTTGDVDFLVQLSAMLEAELYNTVAGQIANNVLGDILGAFNLTDSEPLPPVLWAHDGTASTTDVNAYQVTPLVWLNGNVPRRQARCYLPVFAVSAVDDDGSLDPATLSAIEDFALAWVQQITDGDIAVRRVISNSAGTSIVVPTVAGFNDAMRTQRRRTKGRGS